jgi:hypothetical protein
MNSRQFRVLAVLTVVSGFLGGAVSNLLLQGAPAMAQAGGAVQEVVRAKEFALIDDEGRTRAQLGRNSNGCFGAWVFDAAGEGRLSLTVGPDGYPAMLLYDAAGKAQVRLGANPDGSSYLSVLHAAGKAQARMAVLPDGTPYLALADAAGRIRADLSLLPDGSPHFLLLDAAGKPTWAAPNSDLGKGYSGNAPNQPAARSVPPLFAPPALGQQYLVTGTGHWVKAKLDGGHYITLEDGSLWAISPMDRINTMLWLPVERITVLANPDSLQYPYRLINTDSKSTAEAKYVGKE